MIPVILSGGSGTRLWPLSRGQHPKQFLPLVSNNSMLQETVLRLQGIEGLMPPIGVCNIAHRFMMAEQLREINTPASAIILEPVGKNTAPAVALAAMTVAEEDILLVLPADHVIDDIELFQSAVKQAKILAEQDYLVTFGVVPTKAETGYGYIKAGESNTSFAFKVDSFVEKPDLETAEKYVASGEYFWNSGMFAFKAGRYLEELKKYNSDMLNICRNSYNSAKIDTDFIRLDETVFSQCPSDSIDFAIMEKTDKAVVVPLTARWNDVGSWSALWDVIEKDESGNAIHGDVVPVDTHDCVLHSSSRLITTVGLRDLVVIETADAIMVASKNDAQEVKAIVDKLKMQNRPEAGIHRKVYRPWGYYDSVDEGDRHHTKRIVVNPGAKLSVQKHHHRAEHWIVVKGTAMVQKGEEKRLLSENQSAYIPVGVVHCLENPGVIPLEIIEVQSGSYLGEDDIVRLDDRYGRVTPVS